jgi:hypothetical protein
LDCHCPSDFTRAQPEFVDEGARKIGGDLETGGFCDF